MIVGGLAVALGVAFFAGLVVWLIFLGPWLRQKRWGGLARALSLTPAPAPQGGWVIIPFEGPFPSQPLNGTRGGLPVTVRTRTETYRDSKGQQRTRWFTRASVTLPAPLDLGLHVQKRGLLGRMFDGVTGSQDLEMGVPDTDAKLLIQARDRRATERLIRLGYVAEALGWGARDGWNMTVGDVSVVFETTGIEYSPSHVGRRLDLGVEIAQRLSAGRAETQVDQVEVARAQRWAQVAGELGFESLPNGMRGRHRQMYVEVEQTEREDRFWTRFSCRFDRALGLSMSLTRQTTLSSFANLMAMQDIVVGDARFDDRFVVKGAPEAQVRAVLTPEVREMLITLQDKATHLEVADDHVTAWVGWRVMDVDHLKWGIDTIARTGAAIMGVTPVEIGPYRGA
ncbi:MAG: hypothetical protein KC619_08895 [Myxococcales bacterium]|nr:hypothetical protein [Myxococcales bacterium]